MHIIYTPQRGLDESVATYSFDGEIVTATLNGVTDVFDFSDMPDGAAVGFDSAIDPCPIESAVRDNGVLTVTLRRWYGSPPTRSAGETDAQYDDRLAQYERLKMIEEVTV